MHCIGRQSKGRLLASWGGHGPLGPPLNPPMTEGVSSVGEDAQRDPYSVGSLGQRVPDRSVDSAASILSDPDVRAWAASDREVVDVRAREATAMSGMSHRESVGLLSNVSQYYSASIVE